MGRLRDLFPRLYHLDIGNDAVLGNKGFWREDEWVWNWGWRSELRGRAVTDMHNLSHLVQDIQLKKDTKDKCKWRLDEGGTFTVKGLRDMVDSKILDTTGSTFETSWCKLTPKKVCIFVWRLYHRRIPVRVVLDNMGIDLHSVLCPCCDESIESLDHCFVLCPKVRLGCRYAKPFLA